MSSSSSDSGVDFDLQWLFNFECFHYLGHVYIKEFTAYCIQTGDYFTYYIRSPLGILTNASKFETTTYDMQRSKHGFNWLDGDMSISDFHNLLQLNIPNDGVEILCFSHKVYKYFDWDFRKNYTYSNVRLIRNIHPAEHHTIKCCKKHNTPHCAEMRLFQMVHAMQAVLVPVFLPDLPYDYIRHLKRMKRITESDSKKVSFAFQSLKRTDRLSLAKVSLPNGNCQLCTQGEFERKAGFGSIEKSHSTSQTNSYTPSDETAGAANTQM